MTMLKKRRVSFSRMESNTTRTSPFTLNPSQPLMPRVVGPDLDPQHGSREYPVGPPTLSSSSSSFSSSSAQVRKRPAPSQASSSTRSSSSSSARKPKKQAAEDFFASDDGDDADDDGDDDYGEEDEDEDEDEYVQPPPKRSKKKPKKHKKKARSYPGQKSKDEVAQQMLDERAFLVNQGGSAVDMRQLMSLQASALASLES
jgi:hypothetical protein